MKKPTAAALLFAAACGGTEPGSPDPATVAVSPETAELDRFGETVRLTATVKDRNGNLLEDAPVKWSAEDLDVATVDADGIVGAVGTGTVRIVATAGTVSDSAAIAVTLIQRDALLRLYESLGGDGWNDRTNWGTRTELGAWFGVETDGDGNVIELILQNNNLRGEIPAEVELLDRLQTLDLGFNEAIAGSIPPEIAELNDLVALHLHHNDLVGLIPPQLAKLTGLRSLDLHHNRLSGPLPEWIADLEDLELLSIWRNDFTGPLPSWVGSLRRLQHIDVAMTRMSGRLPRTLMDLDLFWFNWFDTDLCSPPDQEFQDWLDHLDTIQDGRRGRVCSQ